MLVDLTFIVQESLWLMCEEQNNTEMQQTSRGISQKAQVRSNGAMGWSSEVYGNGQNWDIIRRK